MKLLMIIGAMIGFLTGVTLGLVHQAEWPAILWRASLAALAVGVLMRWWGRAWLRGLRQANYERAVALAAQRKETKTAATKKL